MSLDLNYRNVSKVFGQGGKNPVAALREVSFTIRPGELFCLLGPSGCGKTTLLRSTAGLESISGGQIFYGGKDMTSIPPFRRNIGMVFQSFALYPHMNIFENVAYGLRVRKTPEAEVKRKVNAVMELVGLMEELKRNPSPSGLSGGQQQRVAIARALVYDPDILLLDEPLANLDAKLRRYMRAEIRRIQKATNITTIFVTHDQEEAMAVGDRLAVMRRGVVEQIGTSDELYNKPNSAFVANFIGKMNLLGATLASLEGGGGGRRSLCRGAQCRRPCREEPSSRLDGSGRLGPRRSTSRTAFHRQGRRPRRDRGQGEHHPAPRSVRPLRGRRGRRALGPGLRGRHARSRGGHFRRRPRLRDHQGREGFALPARPGASRMKSRNLENAAALGEKKGLANFIQKDFTPYLVFLVPDGLPLRLPFLAAREHIPEGLHEVGKQIRLGRVERRRLQEVFHEFPLPEKPPQLLHRGHFGNGAFPSSSACRWVISSRG